MIGQSGWARFNAWTSSWSSGGIDRLSLGLKPSSQALRACTISAAAPAAFTISASANSEARGSCSSTPMRHLTVTGTSTAAAIAATHSATSVGLAHEAGAEAAALHPVGRAAAIEIDLVVAELGADARRLREPSRLRPAELQRHGMLARVEADQPLARAEHDRVRRHHLGIEPRAAREDAMERPAAPVGPVHHRRHAKSK